MTWWWQVALVLLGSVTVGVAVALYVDSVIKRLRKKRAVAAVPKGWEPETRPETNHQARRAKADSPVAMVPLLSKRSATMLFGGLIVGAVVALAIWMSSPSIVEALGTIRGTNTPPSKARQTGPHETTVTVQLLNTNSTSYDLKALQYEGEYYAAVANSLPFLQSLSGKLAELRPQYPYTAENLSSAIKFAYDYTADVPSIKVDVVGNSAEDASFLASYVPRAFQDFIVTQYEAKRQQDLGDAVAAARTVTESLLDAQKKLAELDLQAVAQGLNNNADYLALTATVQALKAQLDREAADIAAFTASGNTTEAYANNVSAFQRTSKALADAQLQLSTLQAQSSEDLLNDTTSYQTAKADVDRLRAQLSNLNDDITKLSGPNAPQVAAADSFVVGTPTVPVPIPPDRMRLRNALLTGAVIGLVLAWVVLNFRWLKRTLTSSQTSSSPEQNASQGTDAFETSVSDESGPEASRRGEILPKVRVDR